MVRAKAILGEHFGFNGSLVRSSLFPRHLAMRSQISFPRNFDDNVRSAYKGLMDYYQSALVVMGILSVTHFCSGHIRPHDKIFVFGFSRGAYAARALAGLIRKVGHRMSDAQKSIFTTYRAVPDRTSSGRKSQLDLAVLLRQARGLEVR